MFELFMALGLASAVVNVVLSMIIVGELQKRDVRINFFLIRLLIPKYMHQYKTITLQEQGRAGGLFHAWIFSINAALVFAVAGMITLAF
jgi:hypothetical protein